MRPSSSAEPHLADQAAVGDRHAVPELGQLAGLIEAPGVGQCHRLGEQVVAGVVGTGEVGHREVDREPEVGQLDGPTGRSAACVHQLGDQRGLHGDALDHGVEQRDDQLLRLGDPPRPGQRTGLGEQEQLGQAGIGDLGGDRAEDRERPGCVVAAPQQTERPRAAAAARRTLRSTTSGRPSAAVVTASVSVNSPSSKWASASSAAASAAPASRRRPAQASPSWSSRGCGEPGGRRPSPRRRRG